MRRSGLFRLDSKEAMIGPFNEQNGIFSAFKVQPADSDFDSEGIKIRAKSAAGFLETGNEGIKRLPQFMDHSIYA